MKNTTISASVRHVLSLALFAGLAPGVALAQQAAATEAVELEEVVVFGVRASVMDALARKRESNQVMDAISSEDIGKFPDDNIGEALQRIPGMSLDREAGEGKGVSIRGLGAGLSQVSINGQRMASTEGTREFNFSVIDASVVKALEVWKTPMASQDEGSVGGSINIVTRGPLEYRDTRLNLSASGEYEELTDDWGEKYTADLQTQNGAGTLGFGISANYISRLTRSDQVIIPGWAVVNPDSNDWTSRGWNTLAAANGLDYIFYPIDASSRVRTYDRDRLGVTPTLQWRPNDSLEFRLDYYYSKLDDYDDSQSLQVRVRDLVSGNGRNVNNYTWEFDGNAAVYFDATGANIANAWRGYRNTATLRENTWTSKGYNLRVDGQVGEGNEVVVNLGRSTGDGELTTYPIPDFQDAVGFAVDLRDDPRFFQTTINGGGLDDSQLELRTINVNDAFDEEVQEYFQVDFNSERNGRHLRAIRVGAKYHTATTGHTQIRHDSNAVPSGYSLADFALMCGSAPCSLDNFEYANQGTAPLNGTYTFVDLRAVGEAFPREDRATSVRYNESFRVEEETVAGYIQADLDGEMFGVPYRGNIGVRAYKTNLISSGWLDQAGTLPGRVERSYNDILPSLNLAWVLKEDLVLRTGIAKVMARADQEDLSLAGTFNLTEQTARVGNPELDPFRAISFDLGLEWYFSEAGLLSGAIFYKDIESFISQGVIEGGIEVDVGGGVIEVFDAIGPINGEGGKVQGFEVNYQQIYDFLPSPFDGLGTQINYTYTDSNVDIPYIEGGQSFDMPLEGLSKYSYNAVVFWEKERFSARVAYNYRDAFLSNRTNPQGNPVFTDAYGQLDASLNWYINKTFTLSLSGINLNNEARYQYFLVPDRMLAWRASGRRFSVGLRARF